MKMDCEVIRDLLPLYADDACSEKSRIMVEEHLQECGSCREMLSRLKKTEIDEQLLIEKDSVIRDGAQRFKRRAAASGSAVSVLLLLPILAYLVINVYSRSPLGTFFIVAASLLVAASLIVVPLTVSRDRAFWTFCAFCASLILLLAVVCLYTRGDWFWIASSAVLFGLSVVFLPFLVRTRPVRNLIGNARPALVVLVTDAALFINMMNMISGRGRINSRRIVFTFVLIAGIVLVVSEIRKRGKKE